MKGRGGGTGRRLLGGVLLGCALGAAAPGPAAGGPGDVMEPYLRALQAHDEAVLERAAAAPSGLPGALEALFGTLDTEAKLLAIRLVVKQGGPGTGDWLLRRTGDPDVNAAGDAVHALAALASPPPPAALLEAARSRGDAFIREKLYLLAGASAGPGTLALLREAAPREAAPEAARALLSAQARQGDAAARRKLRALVAATPPEGVLEVQELLLYVGERSLARGLLPWLARRQGVMRLGSDRQGGAMARQCDLALWTAHLLGVPLPFPTPHLRIHSAAELAEARKALEALPE